MLVKFKTFTARCRCESILSQLGVSVKNILYRCHTGYIVKIEIKILNKFVSQLQNFRNYGLSYPICTSWKVVRVFLSDFSNFHVRSAFSEASVFKHRISKKKKFNCEHSKRTSRIIQRMFSPTLSHRPKTRSHILFGCTCKRKTIK